MMLSRTMPEAPGDMVDAVPKARRLTLWRSPGVTRFTSRIAAWGLLTGVGSLLLDVALELPLSWSSGAGLVVGGLGAVATSISVLLRSDVRPFWKVGGVLGVPFGLSVAVFGLWTFLTTSFFASNLLVQAVAGTALQLVLILSLVLSVMLGGDVLRFVFKGIGSSD